LRIEPRKQILEIWRAMLEVSYQDRKTWIWGGRDGSNSISDAEQLLCLLHPVNEVETFQLHDPNAMQGDVMSALAPLGTATRIPRVIVDIALEYFERHTRADGEATFGADGYFHSVEQSGPTPAGAQFEMVGVVDAYSISVTLCLAVLAFVRARRPLESHEANLTKLAALGERASARLTAAMTGLLRSFVVNSVNVDSEAGQAILGMLRRRRMPDAELQRRLRDRLSRERAQLRDNVSLAVPDSAKPDDDQLFECGWTWGIAAGASPLERDLFSRVGEGGVPSTEDLRPAIATADGVAVGRPYLRFTVSALDGIVDLQTPRTRALNLLSEEQRRLADALQIRWDLAQRYWSVIARFDSEKWPLEDIPWRTSDNEESDYFSLLVVSVLIQDMSRRATRASDVAKTAGIMDELARRGRITARMTDSDAASLLYFPGVRTTLFGDGLPEPVVWLAYDYAPLLIKRSLQALRLTQDLGDREKFTEIAQAAMGHLNERRLTVRGQLVDLWDDTSRMPGGSPVTDPRPSWYLTERVIEALIVAGNAYLEDPPRSDRISELVRFTLSEADHLYNQELLAADGDDRSVLRVELEEIGSLLSRARELQWRRAATAMSLAERSLRLLDRLAFAREDAERVR
jgi:hypothetical protein